MGHRILGCSLLLVIGLILNSGTLAHADNHHGQAVSEGEELYISYGCAVCHGPNGDGKGLVPVQSSITPTNFTDIKSYRFGTDKNAIKHAIRFGIKEQNAVMPAFGHIPEEELDKLCEFIISLRKQ